MDLTQFPQKIQVSLKQTFEDSVESLWEKYIMIGGRGRIQYL